MQLFTLAMPLGKSSAGERPPNQARVLELIYEAKRLPRELARPSPPWRVSLALPTTTFLKPSLDWFVVVKSSRTRTVGNID